MERAVVVAALLLPELQIPPEQVALEVMERLLLFPAHLHIMLAAVVEEVTAVTLHLLLAALAVLVAVVTVQLEALQLLLVLPEQAGVLEVATPHQAELMEAQAS